MVLKRFQHQPMIISQFNANKDIIWGVVEKKTLFSANSSTVLQLSYENSMAIGQLNCNTAQPWKHLNYTPLSPAGQAPLWLDNPALLQSTCTLFHIGLLSSMLVYFTLLWQDILVFQSEEWRLHPSWKRKVCSWGQRGGGLYGQKSLSLVPDCFSTCKCVLQITVWSERHCLDWSEKSYSDWLELLSSDWMGKDSMLFVEIGFQETCIRAESDGKNTVQ